MICFACDSQMLSSYLECMEILMSSPAIKTCFIKQVSLLNSLSSTVPCTRHTHTVASDAKNVIHYLHPIVTNF